MTTTQSAPGQLEHVREFVNTRDVEQGTDELRSADDLAAWLRERDLLPSGAKVGPAALDRALRLREALRGLLLANNGAELDAGAIRTLNDAISEATLSVRFDGDGRAGLRVGGSGPGAVVAPLVAVVYEAMVEGTWSRLKACPADSCHWAFYDRSRNHSGTWCAMRVCGNRAKVRAYRERKAPKRSGRKRGGRR